MDESEPKSITILLVEDEPLVAKIQQKQLEAEGYRVLHANDGLTALTLCRQQPGGIQLILMDIDLGEGIDGAETARQILREHDLPILFLSSHVEPEFVEKTEAIASYGYLVKGSAPSILYASIRMALRLYSARQLASKLSEQENQFKRMFDAIPDLISIHDSQMNILYSNAKVLNVDCSDSLLGRKCYEAYRHRTSVCPDCKQKEVLSNKEIINTEMELDGHWVELRVIPLSNKNAKPDRFMEWVHDVSDQKQLQQSLSFQKLLYEAVLESSTMSIFALDTQYQYISFNQAHAMAMQAMYGVSIQQGHSFYEYQTVPEDIAKSKPNIDRCLRGEQFTECAYSGSAGFTRAYVEVSHNPIRSEAGSIIGASFFMRDISERKLAEDRIKELLHEKELLLKETHHRVRNNLNTVYSLLNLRAESALAGYDRNSLAEAAGSVKAMLLLYNRLYLSPDFTEIRLSAYLESLVKEILEGFTGIVSVKTTIDIPEISLKPVILSNIGIITNELLTNSVKYAFRGRRKGTISIKAELHNDSLVLEYGDDGPGFPQIPADALPALPAFGNFGLKLVMALVRQLHGTLQLDNSDGALCRICIPLT